MAQQGAHELAYSILEIGRGTLDPLWLREEFERRQMQRINNHIRFADFWYTANAQFTDLQEFTKELAADNGLNLSPEEAWRWLAQGGFIDDTLNFGTAGFSLDQVKDLGNFIVDMDAPNFASKNNVFELDLQNATWRQMASYHGGRVIQDDCYIRGDKLLPLNGPIELLVRVLQKAKKLPEIRQLLMKVAEEHQRNREFMENVMLRIGIALEAMITDGWVKASYDPSLPLTSDPKRPTGLSINIDPPVHSH
jgi:hypothetical protein